MSDTKPQELERLSIFKLAVLAAPWIAIQAIWSTEFGVTTPVLESYGLEGSFASLIWIFGPITGFFTAPIVGAISDRSTSKYGRRRPFIVAGLLLTMVASAVFAFSYLMGSAKTVVGFLAFICLDITINVMQTPLRAFCSDQVPESQQATVQLMSALFQGVGGMLGFGLMRLLWTGEPSELPRLFGIVMALNVVLISSVCLAVKEKPQTEARNGGSSIGSVFVEVFASVPKMQPTVALVCAIEFFSWAALFSWWPTSSTWFARNVYGGCLAADAGCSEAQQQLYKDGTAVYGESGIFANLLQTAFSLGLALALQYGVIRRMRVPYAFCLAVGAVFLVLAKFGPQNHTFGYIVALVMAVPISAVNSFPFAIVGKQNAGKSQSDVGMQMGQLNLFICSPQLIITFVISAMRSGLGDQGLPWGLLLAGVCFGVASVLAFFIRETDSVSAKDEKAAA
ncbi:hypothetical protein H9P43_000982 [Blastocladiella emersonii ATCC 22665]|nr:hypothetical protein H9P43_000982 [Blastocladiella emersonii ATCC 22665]